MRLKPTEKEIQKAILDYLKFRGLFAWRNNTGGFIDKRDHYYTFGKKGSGDILGLTKDGRFFSIEVKVPGKNPTPEQTEFINNVIVNNGIAFVARSIDDVQKFL
jgi:hypothetical protein